MQSGPAFAIQSPLLLTGPGANEAAEAAQLRVRRDGTQSMSISPFADARALSAYWKTALKKVERGAASEPVAHSSHMSAVSSSSAYVPGELEPTPFNSTTVAPPAVVTTTSPNPEVALLRRQTNAHMKSPATGAPIKTTSSERQPRTWRHSTHSLDKSSVTDSSLTLVDTQQPTRSHSSSSASTAIDSDARGRASWTSGGFVESLRERVTAVFSRTPRVATDPVSSFQTNSQSAPLGDTPISSASTPNERTQTGAERTSFDEDEAVRAQGVHHQLLPQSPPEDRVSDVNRNNSAQCSMGMAGLLESSLEQ